MDGELCSLSCLRLRPSSSILVSSDHKTFFHLVSELQGAFWQSPNEFFLRSGFFLATVSNKPQLWSAYEIVLTCTQWRLFAIKSCNFSKVVTGLLVVSLTSSFLLALSFSLKGWPDPWRGLLVPNTSVLQTLLCSLGLIQLLNFLCIHLLPYVCPLYPQELFKVAFHP